MTEIISEEMIEAGERAYMANIGVHHVPTQVRAIYTAMRALEPKVEGVVERLIAAFESQDGFVQRDADYGKTIIDGAYDMAAIAALVFGDEGGDA